MSILSDHIREFEGLRLEAYEDVGGILTIGYGHTGPDVVPGMVISLDEAEALLEEDMKWAKAAIKNTVTVPLTASQHAALVSLAYNIGAGAWSKSTALRRLNAGDYAGAAEAITWWNKVQGKIVNGLVRRREAERTLFMQDVVGEEAEASTGSIGGGEAKSLWKSLTTWLSGGGLVATIADAGGAFQSFKAQAPEILAVYGAAVVFAIIFLAIMLRRRSEAKRGEH